MLIVKEKTTNQDRPNSMKTIVYKLALALLALSTIIAHPSTACAQAAGNWGNYTGTIINNTITNSPPAGNLFFRLKQ